MAKRINYAKLNAPQEEKKPQTCRNCRWSRDYHEASFVTKQPFLCKCDFKEWSQFLDIENQCKNYRPR